MKIQQGLSNQPAFGQTTVKIKYKELKDMGSDVVELAEKIKSRLETRDPSVKYKIGRVYQDELIGHSLSFIPTDEIYVSAKKVNLGFKTKLKNLFMMNLPSEIPTKRITERSLMRAANKATKEAQKTQGESIFSLLRPVTRLDFIEEIYG